MAAEILPIGTLLRPGGCGWPARFQAPEAAMCHSRSFSKSGNCGRREQNSHSFARRIRLASQPPANSSRMCSSIISAVVTGVRSPRCENEPGEFFVDHTCIDCDTCRWMAPEVFSRIGSMSAVHHQPEGEEENLKALQALLACPTASIHTKSSQKDISKVHDTFPIPVDPLTLPGVFHCGYHSKQSYGAASYFIQSSHGNILVDSPQFSETFAKVLEKLGGVRHMFLTHRDDVADHEKWAKRFNCQRVLHEMEVTSATEDVELKLHGNGPWMLGSDIDLIFTPGHTEGCVSLLWKPGEALFTGDHLAFSGRSDSLSIFRSVNWYSVKEQISRVEKLLDEDFVWLLPGHGRRYFFKTISNKNDMLRQLVEIESGFVLGKK